MPELHIRHFVRFGCRVSGVWRATTFRPVGLVRLAGVLLAAFLLAPAARPAAAQAQAEASLYLPGAAVDLSGDAPSLARTLLQSAWVGAVHNQVLAALHREEARRGLGDSPMQPAELTIVEALRLGCNQLRSSHLLPDSLRPHLPTDSLLRAMARTWDSLGGMANDSFRHALYQHLNLTPNQQTWLELVYNPGPFHLAGQGAWLPPAPWDSGLLSPQELPLPGAVYGVSQASRSYWSHFYDSLQARADPWRSEQSRKVPLNKLIRADGFGFLKGLLTGGVLFGSGELAQLPRAATVSVGILAALVFPAVESYIYARRYKKGRLSKDEYERYY